MLPSKEEMEEFVKEIPETPEGKLKAMNKLFFKDENMEEALKQMQLFFMDLIKNNPDYLEAIKTCTSEEAINKTTKEFFEKNPKMIEEILLSMLAVKRDKWEEKEKSKTLS